MDDELTHEQIAEQIAEIEAMPCEMYYEPPFDFAYCERHDTTFALGDVCKYFKKLK